MNLPRTAIALSERAQFLFKALVERYIEDGQPVGSRTLARETRLDLSAATIRNVMADLEDLGLIRAPHTSAGRVPTVRGYRLFVDSMMKVRGLSSSEVERIHHGMEAEPDVPGVLARTSSMLSEVSRFASIVMIPKVEHQALRHVDFLPLSDNRVLAILVVNGTEVQNRIIHTARSYTASELERAANYLNQAFSGRDLGAVRKQILNEMSNAREAMDRAMQAVIEMTEKAIVPTMAPSDFVLAGQTRLMGIDELSDMEKLRQLFEAFNQKRDILHLLDQALNAQGVQIFIGEESGYKALDDCSVVTATYEADGRVLGVLGVIGPTRMPYQRVVSVVDVTAKLLSSALKSRH